MDQSQIDRILEMNNIVDVIGSYFPLKKSGSNYKALCPFHQEKTPSFHVSEKKQIFKCFGCGKAGNVITFVQDYEKLSFMETIKKLAGRVGITISESPQAKLNRSKMDLIYKIYELAADYFQRNLKDHGSFARNYLKERNISTSIVEEFGIGYALNSQTGLMNYLLKNHINEQILLKSGLFGRGERGIYDIFRERLIFPIHNIAGRVVAFGGRVLQKDQKGGKYINSPTTDIYTKGAELYGLYKTRFEISRQDAAIVCEGYTDFIRLHEKGFTNIVASLGTALTDKQVMLLKRYTNNVYLFYDGDNAGKIAAVRAAGNLIKNSMNAWILEVGEKDDPDSFLVKFGVDALQEKITNSQSLTLFLFNDKIMGMDTRQKLETLIEIANGMNDRISQELFFAGCS